MAKRPPSNFGYMWGYRFKDACDELGLSHDYLVHNRVVLSRETISSLRHGFHSGSPVTPPTARRVLRFFRGLDENDIQVLRDTAINLNEIIVPSVFRIRHEYQDAVPGWNWKAETPSHRWRDDNFINGETIKRLAAGFCMAEVHMKEIAAHLFGHVKRRPGNELDSPGDLYEEVEYREAYLQAYRPKTKIYRKGNEGGESG